jgi:hypothetical protein
MPRGNCSTNRAFIWTIEAARVLGIIDNRISGPNTHQQARKPDTETYA